MNGKVLTWKKLIIIVLVIVIIAIGYACGSSKGPWHSSRVTNDGMGPYHCYGKHNTCKNKTYNYRDMYCDSCDPNGDNIEG